MLPTSAPRPMLNCEGSGREKTCGGFEKRKRKKGSGLWCGFSQTICQSAGVRTLAKCGQGNIFQSISSLFKYKKNEKKWSTLSSRVLDHFSSLVSFAYYKMMRSISRMFFSLYLHVINYMMSVYSVWSPISGGETRRNTEWSNKKGWVTFCINYEERIGD